MARIRSIKPHFFRHEGLYESERETGLPLRLAFAGLWTAADREGRFIWSARNLKLDALPYDDDVDFARVLDALWSRGSIKKYVVDGKEYGFIPSWLDHQVINNREAPSNLPEPNETNTLTREARDDDASVTPLKSAQAEGKGREGERKGTDKGTRDARSSEVLFEDFWRAYPKRKGANPRKTALAAFLKALKVGEDPQAIIAGAKRCAVAESENINTKYIPQAVKWLHDERWKDYNAAAIASLPSREEQERAWRFALDYKERKGFWDLRSPEPGSRDCKIPPEFIEQWKAERAKQGATP